MPDLKKKKNYNVVGKSWKGLSFLSFYNEFKFSLLFQGSIRIQFSFLRTGKIFDHVLIAFVYKSFDPTHRGSLLHPLEQRPVSPFFPQF